MEVEKRVLAIAIWCMLPLISFVILKYSGRRKSRS